MRHSSILILLASLVVGTACREPDQRAGQASAEAPASQATVVDSVIPRDEALRRFRVGLTQTDALAGGAGSRAELVQRFVTALEKRDTAAFAPLVLDRTEFAFIYYPTNPQSLPPYDLSPALMWFMIDQNSRKGLGHALEERGGRPLHAVGHTCQGTASHEGSNTVWGPCFVRRVQAPADTVAERLFGPIIERGGPFKFVSYSNKL